MTSILSNPMGITMLGGNLWFTEQGAGSNNIGEMDVSGTMLNEFPIGGSGTSTDGVAAGPDGNLWFTQQSGVVGKMTTAGVTATFTPTGTAAPGAIVAGPDGDMWFIDQGNNAVGRISMSGTIDEFPVPTPGAFSANVPPTGLTVGPDGNIWFTEQDVAAAIGKLTIQPTASLSSSSLTFGSQAVGTTSTAQVLTVTSTAGGTLDVTGTALSGPDAADFHLTDACTGATVVPATPTCTVGVAFAPSAGAAGSRSATMTVHDNAGTGTQTVAVSGTATAGAVAFDQTSVAFGTRSVGTTSTATTLTLTNNSGGSVPVTSTTVAGADAADFPVTTTAPAPPSPPARPARSRSPSPPGRSAPAAPR